MTNDVKDAKETKPDEPRTLGNVLENLRFAMVTTAAGNGTLSSRPLSVARIDDDRVWFLISTSYDWVEDLYSRPQVNVSFSHPGKNRYVAISGSAAVSQEAVILDQLWNPAAAAFFDGGEDPNLAAVSVAIDEGTYWDGPSSTIGQAASFLRVWATNNPDAAGDEGPVIPGDGEKAKG